MSVTLVAPERQNELTRRVQQKLANAGARAAKTAAGPAAPPPPPATTPELPPNLVDTASVTPLVQ